MKRYLSVLLLLLVGVVCAMLGLGLLHDEESAQLELTGEAWCEAMMEKPNPEWTDAETRSFAKTCLNP